MKTIGLAAGALALASALPALAQTTKDEQPPPGERPAEAADVLMKTVRAPKRAFELGVDGGYAQGFGSMYGGLGVGALAAAGGTLGVGLGYRIDPRWSVGLTGRYEGFGAGYRQPTGTSVQGVVAGVQGTYHTAPYSRVDPYVTLGAGYRALIESPRGAEPATMTHGFELARIELGLDVRASESVAISPILGADLSMFMWKTGGGAETARLTDRGVSTFVFAGVKGRFDFGGTREAKPEEPEKKVGRR